MAYTPPTGAGRCTEPATATQACIASVRGTVLDASGAGITLPINLCTSGICFSAPSDEGLFAFQVDKVLDLSQFMIHAYGHPEFSDTFIRLARPATENVTLMDPVLVTRLEHRGPLVPEVATSRTVLRAGPVEISLPPGANVGFYPAHVDEGRALRAGVVPDPKRLEPNILALFGLGPFGARLSATADVALTLPPGTAKDGEHVEFVVLEDDLTNPNVAKLVLVGSGTVQGDVARTAVGGGISRLTWVGVRKPAEP